jgi:uncharacterized membrane protein
VSAALGRALGALLAGVSVLCGCVVDADTESGDEDGTEAEGCGEDVPVLTWESFGEGFVTTYCQGCHASTAPDRHGAPEHVAFDTEEDAMLWRYRILATAGFDGLTMPPGGGPTDEDRALLEAWLGCADP